MAPKGLRVVAIICAAAVFVILVAVYAGCKLLRRRTLPLAPASDSESEATVVEPTSSDGIRAKESSSPPPSEPLGIILAPTPDDRAAAAGKVTNIYDEILKATGNFSGAGIIGYGGFGTVYGGELPAGRRVAVKRLHGSFQCLSARRFLAEMEAVAEVKHQNLVPLVGYCARGDECFLIYKRMRHGSLASWLRNLRLQANNAAAAGLQALGWPVRLEICLGSARGLAFLHHGGFASQSQQHLTHGDVKSSNILLDELMRPRVSDFGVARIIRGYETHVRTGDPGSRDYVPPEYTLAMKCTAKGDVYGFGVVMLEVLTGRPAAGGQEVGEGGGGGELVGWVRWMVAHGREGELFDPSLPVSGLWCEQMARVLDLARECTDDEPWKRPTMGRVVEELVRIQLMEHGPRGVLGREIQA
jgi:hypothetical protein